MAQVDHAYALRVVHAVVVAPAVADNDDDVPVPMMTRQARNDDTAVRAEFAVAAAVDAPPAFALDHVV